MMFCGIETAAIDVPDMSILQILNSTRNDNKEFFKKCKQRNFFNFLTRENKFQFASIMLVKSLNKEKLFQPPSRLNISSKGITNSIEVTMYNGLEFI